MIEKKVVLKMPNKKLAILSIFIAVLFVAGAGCNNEESNNNSSASKLTSTPMKTSTPTPTPTNPAEKNNVKYSLPTDEEIKALDKIAENKQMVIETTKGTIKLKFYPKDAPLTVANFMKLAEAKFYDGLTFHRVEPGFVVQGGDPLGNGMGGPGYNVRAEFNSQKHLTGTVAMARAQDPNSAGSQFYITLAPQPFLDNQYTVFGQVTSGMDVVQKIQVEDKMTKVYIEK